MPRDENPYAAPFTAPDEPTSRQRMLPHADVRFWPRFVAALGAMAIANMVPLYFTWRAYWTDGYETIGWPWAFRKFGGIEGGYYVHPVYFVGDALIAVGVAYVVATAMQNGWCELFRRLQTWGIWTPAD